MCKCGRIGVYPRAVHLHASASRDKKSFLTCLVANFLQDICDRRYEGGGRRVNVDVLLIVELYTSTPPLVVTRSPSLLIIELHTFRHPPVMKRCTPFPVSFVQDFSDHAL